MDEKKSVKVSLGTVVCICIITILLCVIVGMWFYFTNINKNEKPVNQNNGQNIVSKNEEVVKQESNQNIISNNEEDSKPNQQDNSKNIIIYLDENIANAKPGLNTGLDINYEDSYNTTYEIYENGKKVGTTKGVVKKVQFFEREDYIVEFEHEDYEITKKRIYVSCNYNVVPRQYENISKIPESIKMDFQDCDSVKVQSIDLDGDGKKEFVVAYAKDNMAGVSLYDSEYRKISPLANHNDNQYLSNFDYITYMDVDNDGIMEIIMSIPVIAPFYRYGIYKYENNNIKGEIDYFTLAT